MDWITVHILFISDPQFRMAPDLDPLTSDAIEKAVAAFNSSIALRGLGYYRSGCVKPVPEPTGDRFTFQVAGSRRSPYRVIVDTSRLPIQFSCDCPFDGACKHVYAALMFLRALIHKRADTAPGVLKTEEPPNPFSALVAAPESLTAHDRAFLSNLQRLYLNHTRSNHPDPLLLKKLFPEWPIPALSHPEAFAPKQALTPAQFWHFIIHNLRKKRLRIPTIFGKENDLTPSEELISEWEYNVTCETWSALYNRRSLLIGERPIADYRWVLGGDSLTLEISPPSQSKFRKVNGEELRALYYVRNYDSASIGSGALIDPGALPWALPLVNEHLRHVSGGYVKIPFSFELAWRFNALMHIPDVSKRVVLPDGRPLQLTEHRLEWRSTFMPGVRNAYQIQLWLDDTPVEGVVRAFPGSEYLYLINDKLFPGNPPPFPSNPIEVTTAIIPQPVFETPAALERAITAGATLPPALEARVDRLTLKPIIKFKTAKQDNEESCTILFYPQLVNPQTLECLQTYGQSGWEKIGPIVRSFGDRFTLFLMPDFSEFHQALASLPSIFDYFHQAWRLKNPKRSAQILADWLNDLGRGIEIEIPPDLGGLGHSTLDVDLSLNLKAHRADWFDLQLGLPQSEIAFTDTELQLLLARVGSGIRLESRAHRQIRLRVPPGLREALDQIGLSLEELTGDAQQLHAVHLKSLLDAGILSEAVKPEVERRLQSIKTAVVPALPSTIQVSLRPYQIAGYHFLAYLAENGFGGILADDMGLGKTLQALTWLVWLQTLRSETDERRSLIICPKSVVDNWVVEAKKYTPSLLVDAPAGIDIKLVRLPPRSVIVLNYTQLRLLGSELEGESWHAIIFDEGQYLKNPSSQTTQIARKLKGQHKILLTGTPIENRLLDLWSLLQCVMPGVLGPQSTFRRRFQEKGDSTARERIAKRIRPFLLRRTKEAVAPELPPRIEEDIRCEMEGVQEDLYRAELKLARQHLLNIQTHRELDRERFNLLTTLLRMRQICCHPLLVKKDVDAPNSAKLLALADLIEPLISEGNKVLIFSQFVEMLKLIETSLSEFQAPIYKLTGKTKDRAKVIESFQNENGASVFLISLKAGGSGLNLAAASYVVLFDPWWNPAVERQAIDRAHRIGQTKTVFAYQLLIRDSIEDKIRQLQTYKRHLANDVLGEQSFSQALTLEDFHYLLG